MGPTIEFEDKMYQPNYGVCKDKMYRPDCVAGRQDVLTQLRSVKTRCMDPNMECEDKCTDLMMESADKMYRPDDGMYRQDVLT